MAKKKQKKISPEIDLNYVVGLIKKGEIDGFIKKLDPDDVTGTLKSVPAEIIRLLLSFSRIGDIDEMLKEIKREQRKPVRALLVSAQKYKGEEFVKALLDKARQDEKVLKPLGITIPSSHEITMEATIDNSITMVNWTPQFMLRSSRVCVELSFMQGENLLFRTSADIDRVLWLASACLKGASRTLTLLAQNLKQAKPAIDFEACERELKKIGETAIATGTSLAKFSPPSRKTGADKKRRTGATRTAKKTTRKRERASR